MKLLPRLDRTTVGLVVAKLNEAKLEAPDEARALVEEASLHSEWNSSGGARVSETERESFAEKLRSIARDHGYPDYPQDRQKQGFDRAVCRALVEEQMLVDAQAETLRASCWAGLTIFDVLDLAIWRHANPGAKGKFISADRLQGGNRNLLRRLWLRNQALLLDDAEGEQRWMLVDSLSEDACVAIVERPSIAADRRLARAIGLAWLEKSKAGISMEPVMRAATRKIRALAETRMISVLSDEELLALVSEAFDRAESIEAGVDFVAQETDTKQPRPGTLRRFADALFGR